MSSDGKKIPYHTRYPNSDSCVDGSPEPSDGVGNTTPDIQYSTCSAHSLANDDLSNPLIWDNWLTTDDTLNFGCSLEDNNAANDFGEHSGGSVMGTQGS
jgi:hypothetical protein